jgi:hypothetical protein
MSVSHNLVTNHDTFHYTFCTSARTIDTVKEIELHLFPYDICSDFEICDNTEQASPSGVTRSFKKQICCKSSGVIVGIRFGLEGRALLVALDS